MSKINKVKCQMSKINKVNFDGAYLRSSSGHFLIISGFELTAVHGALRRLVLRYYVTIYIISRLEFSIDEQISKCLFNNDWTMDIGHYPFMNPWDHAWVGDSKGLFCGISQSDLVGFSWALGNNVYSVLSNNDWTLPNAHVRVLETFPLTENF